MRRGKKLERTLWTGLAVTAFTAGIAVAPRIDNTVKKFGKWFEKNKIERIEQGHAKPAPILKTEKKTISLKNWFEKNKIERIEQGHAKPAPILKTEKKTISLKNEKTEEEEKQKTNQELLASIPSLDRDEFLEILEHLDEKNAGEQRKKKAIDAYNLFLKLGGEDCSWDNRKAFKKIVENTDEDIDVDFIEDYNKMAGRVMEEGKANNKDYFYFYNIEKLAEKGILNRKVMDIITTTLNKAQYTDYSFECLMSFLENRSSSDIEYLEEGFGLKFAQITNQVYGTLSAVFASSMHNPDINQYMINENYLKRIQTNLDYIRKSVPYKKREKMNNALSSIMSSPGSEYFSKADIMAGEAMAESLGLYDFEIGMNFGFAINAVGEEKTVKLHDEYGIVYFGRYDKNVLDEAYNSIDQEYKKDKPVALVVYSKDDWNGAFYIQKNIHRDLKKGYKMVIYETNGEGDFRNAIFDTYKRHGDIDVLMIGGHGQPRSISLGEGYGETYKIDLDDKGELAYLRFMLTDNPKIILNSCSTGKDIDSIGSMLSDVFDATLWAPVDPLKMQKLSLNPDGLLEDMSYMGAKCRKFVDGKIVDTKKSDFESLEDRIKK